MDGQDTTKGLSVQALFHPLRNERAFESIARQLRESIYSGNLKPGDKLPTERELAQIFNTSRVSVRSALLNLEHSGLLRIKKGASGGFFIGEVNSKAISDSLSAMLRMGKASISDLTEARTILEPQAARLAAKRATVKDIKKIEQAVLSFRDRIQQKLAPDPSDLNFHICVAEASRNPVMILISRSLMELLFQKIGAYLVNGKGNERIVRGHERILEAIKKKDGQKAQALMLKHIKSMKRIFGELE